MHRADFVWVNFDHNFAPGDVEHRQFNLDAAPVEASAVPGLPSKARAVGYLLIQASGVGHNNHQIEINGNDLPAFDLPAQSGPDRFLWMDRIPPGFLQAGNNRLTIRNVAPADRFRIDNVVVSWREA